MLWTEEAIGLLKRLALEGRSASAIARALGVASRSAVIGKANRIGVKLNGDGRASAPKSGRAGACRPPSAAPARATPAADGESSAFAGCYSSAAKRGEERKTAWIFAGAEVGEMRRVRLEDIRQSACRWPLGDPGSGDFAYCGLTSAEGRSYCAGHCRLAYCPPAARRSRNDQRSRRSSASSWRLS